jgi:putative glycosyltransferase (TIGR04372 family)
MSLSWRQRWRRITYFGYPVLRLCLTVLYYPLGRLIALFGIRFLISANGKFHLGHLAMDPLVYFQGEAIGVHPKYRAIMLVPPWHSPNRALARYWNQRLRVVTNPIAAALLTPFNWLNSTSYQIHFDYLTYDSAETGTLRHGAAMDAILGRYAQAHPDEPFMTVSEGDQARGQRVLSELGVKEEDWWVCLHARQSGYHNPENTKGLLRDTDPAAYLLAAKAITDRGGWVIRIGDPSMTPLPAMDRVIDYVHTDYRADWMDVFLIGRCRFILGTSSGPIAVAWMFGRPVAAVDYVPLSMGPLGQSDVYLPKLYWSEPEQRLLTFAEILLTDKREYMTDTQFSNDSLEWRDNTPEEIRDLALEMLDRLDGIFEITDRDHNMQTEFRRLWGSQRTMQSFGDRSYIGRDFLRDHSLLLK